MIGARLFWHIPINIAQAAVGFGTIWTLTRLLSPADYGLYALILSAAQLAHTLSITWVEAAAFRFLPAQKSDQDRADHFATLLVLAIGAALFAALATWLAIGAFASQAKVASACGFAGAFSFFRFLTRILRETDRAEHRVARYSILESLYLLLGFALGIGLIVAFDMGQAGPFAGALIGGVLIALIDVPHLIMRARGGKAQGAHTVQYAGYGMPLAMALALELAVQTSTRGLIAHELDAASVGAFAAAFGLAGRTLDLVFIWAGMATGPLLLSAYEKDGRAGAEKIVGGIGLAFLALAAPAALGVALTAKPLSEAMVGEGLRDQVAALAPWLAAAALAQGFLTYYFSEAFQLARRTGLRAALMAAPALTTVALTALLLPRFGLTGAAIATLCATCLGMALLAVIGRRFVRLAPPLDQSLKVLAATGAMIPFVTLAPALGGWAECFIKALIGATAYALALLALNPANLRGETLRVLASARASIAKRFGMAP
jgi:O-antigen/teichoic acid export membrane protein